MPLRFSIQATDGLAHGLLRVHCDDCGKGDVVAFSCKGRGFCPSCGTARMVDTAAWLCDAVIPEVPVRQWVLSLPYRVRTLCAHDASACRMVRNVLVRAVSGFYERTARRAGVPRPRAGAVAFVQRFDSGLRLNVHFHVLWLDGVYGWEPGRTAPRFAEQRAVTDGDVQLLVSRIRDRVRRALRKAGKWVDPLEAASVGELFVGLAASVLEPPDLGGRHHLAGGPIAHRDLHGARHGHRRAHTVLGPNGAAHEKRPPTESYEVPQHDSPGLGDRRSPSSLAAKSLPTARGMTGSTETTLGSRAQGHRIDR